MTRANTKMFKNILQRIQNAAAPAPIVVATGDFAAVHHTRRLEDLDRVYALTHDCYVSKGYAEAQPDGRLIHYPEFESLDQTIVLIASNENKIIGSLSMTIDGPEGLPMDHDFRDECDAMRAEGRHLAGAWRLVIDNSCNASIKVVMSLMSQLAHHATAAGANTWLFTVNPKHEMVYRRLFNMKVVVRKDHTQGLKNAPAVFMRCDIENLPLRWRQWLSNPIAVA